MSFGTFLFALADQERPFGRGKFFLRFREKVNTRTPSDFPFLRTQIFGVPNRKPEPNPCEFLLGSEIRDGIPLYHFRKKMAPYPGKAQNPLIVLLSSYREDTHLPDCALGEPTFAEVLNDPIGKIKFYSLSWKPLVFNSKKLISRDYSSTP